MVCRKSDLTSAVATVKSDELAATSVTSLDQGLQGRAAGVVVLNTSGQPGAGRQFVFVVLALSMETMNRFMLLMVFL